MLIKMLSEADRVHLLDLASLFTIADKPLLWDGKTYEELTPQTSLDEVSIKVGKREREIMEELQKDAGVNQEDIFGIVFSYGAIDKISGRLVDVLKNYPFVKMEDPGARVAAGTTVLLELLAGKNYDLPSTPKIILYELLLVALRDGHISGVEWALLKEFQRYCNLEDFIFNDLLERAEYLNQEISKTISIVLE
ncbi:hypothetical protein [Billgrantia gudaonensis]|nr:hypothetical protein [Halomonas gudaonensis]